MKFIKLESVRFLIAGSINTVLTYLLYLLVLPWVGYVAAFTISFAVGVLFSFVLNAVYVFKVVLVWSRLIKYPSLYFFQYILGLILITALVEYFGVDDRFAPFVNVVILIPITFMLNRWFFKKGNSDA